MKKILIAIAILLSAVCYGQVTRQISGSTAPCQIHIGMKQCKEAKCKNYMTGTWITTSHIDTTGNMNTAIGMATLGQTTTGSNSTRMGYDYPAYKKEKCIVIYLDGLEVKADSATKVYKADTSRYEYTNPNKITDLGNGLYSTTAMAYIPQVVPDWYLLKVIRKNKKEIPLKDIIQYK